MNLWHASIVRSSLFISVRDKSNVDENKRLHQLAIEHSNCEIVCVIVDICIASPVRVDNACRHKKWSHIRAT